MEVKEIPERNCGAASSAATSPDLPPPAPAPRSEDGLCKSDAEEPASSLNKRLGKETEKCRVCFVKEAKYKCPLCLERTCSVPCYKQHLRGSPHLSRTRSADPFLCHVEGEAASVHATQNCASSSNGAGSGTAEEERGPSDGSAKGLPLGSRVSLRIKFVGMREFDDEQLRRDVKLLEGASRALEAAQRQRLETTNDTFRRKRGSNPQQLRTLCHRRGTDFVFFPPSHSRRTTNRTRVFTNSDRRKKVDDGESASQVAPTGEEQQQKLGAQEERADATVTLVENNKDEKDEKEEAEALPDGVSLQEEGSQVTSHICKEPKISWQVGVRFPALDGLRVVFRISEEKTVRGLVEALQSVCLASKLLVPAKTTRPCDEEAADEQSGKGGAANEDAQSEALREYFEKGLEAAAEENCQMREDELCQFKTRLLLPLPRGRCQTAASFVESVSSSSSSGEGEKQRAYLLPWDMTLRDCLVGTTVVEHPEVVAILPRELDEYTCWEPPIRGGPASRLLSPRCGAELPTSSFLTPEQSPFGGDIQGPAEEEGEAANGRMVEDCGISFSSAFHNHAGLTSNPTFADGNGETSDKRLHSQRFSRKRRGGRPWSRGGCAFRSHSDANKRSRPAAMR